MGYCANGGGEIVFQSTLTAEEKKMVEGYLYDSGMEFSWYADDDEIEFYLDYRWFSNTTENLNKIAKKMKIESGCAQFDGEDGSHWKIKYDPEKNSWFEINGDVVFDDEKPPAVVKRDNICEFVGQIIDIFEDFLETRKYCGNNTFLLETPENKDVNSAIIYGMDYGELQSNLEEMMINWGVIES